MIGAFLTWGDVVGEGEFQALIGALGSGRGMDSAGTDGIRGDGRADRRVRRRPAQDRGPRGSAHTEAELGILIERAREMLADPAQGAFDLGIEPAVPRARLVAPAAAPALFDAEPRDAAAAAARPARVISTDSRLLFQALDGIYDDLGFDALGDDVFRDLVLARIVEPTSILDTGRVLADLGARRPATRRCAAPWPAARTAATGTRSPSVLRPRAGRGDISLVPLRRDDAVLRGRERG